MSRLEELDPLTLSLVEGRLDSINEELGEMMMRQAFAFATARIRDLGTVLFDKQERIITVGNWMPVHTAGADVCLRGMLDWIGRDNIHPDDFVIGNDPFIVRFGHLPDWSFARPIFHEDELVFYHYARTHQHDGGGAFPGCYFPRGFDCHSEGLMIPPVKLIEGGELDEKVFSVILRNLRASHMVRSDNMLVYASMRKADERIQDMLRSYGKDTVLAACDELLRRTEETVRKRISAWPAGVHRAERAADWDGTTDRPVWVRLALTVEPEDGQLVFDYSDSDPQVDFINVPLGQVWSSVVLAVAWFLPPGTPRNQGLINCIKIITKEGTVLSPTYPATSGAQAASLGAEVTECAQLALSRAVPESACALWARQLNPAFYGRRPERIDPRTKQAYFYHSGPFHSTSSMGAVCGYDGTDGRGSAVTAAGAAIRSAVEVEEWDTPYRWLHYEFSTDSAGEGQSRGGLGTHVEYLNTEDPNLWHPHDNLVATGQSDGEKFGALGALGGMEGPKHRLWIARRGKKVPLRCCDMDYLEPGDVLVTYSGGGGGVGDPWDRDVDKVRWDVLNEYVSVEAAGNIYGVIVDSETLEVNQQATTELRNRMKSGRALEK